MRVVPRLLNDTRTSALAQRFQSILDEKISHSSASLIDKDPTLRKLYNEYAGEESHGFEETKATEEQHRRQFEYKYQKELAYVKSEHLLRSKEDRKMDKPWTGTEPLHDTALRMLVDSAPKAKALRKDRIITPPTPLSERVRSAKETSLDYTISKGMSSDEKEREAFREEYKERLLGPSMFMDTSSSRATLGLVSTMADARINAEIDKKTGTFRDPEMHGVRGKPLDKERLSNAGDSSFFLNEMLKNQDCLPTWIENQQGIERDIQAFRHNLRVTLHNELMADLTAKHGKSREKLVRELKINSEGIKATVLKNHRSKHSHYLSAKIDQLNRGIRNYNLQCPSSSLHKWKLVQENELEKQYASITSDTEGLVEQYLESYKKIPESIPQKPSGSLLGIFESRGASIHTGHAPPRPHDGLQFWKSVKSIFH